VPLAPPRRPKIATAALREALDKSGRRRGGRRAGHLWESDEVEGELKLFPCVILGQSRAVAMPLRPKAHKRIVKIVVDCQQLLCQTAALMKILDVPQSGSVGGVTSSRNRFGQYRRTRATPVNPRSAGQAQSRSRMSVNAALWRTLTGAQRAGWMDLGLSMVRNDALGQSYTLTGFQAFCSINNTLASSSAAGVTAAPALITPPGLLTGVLTATAATLSLAYTVTPLGAGVKLQTFASPQRSAGRSFEGDFRQLQVSVAAAVSPADLFAAYSAKFGAPVLGNRIFVSAVCTVGGFQSGAFVTSAVVTA
jgi:hypothetical protein